MKTKKVIFISFLFFNFLIGFGQEKTRREMREERKLEKQKEIEMMVNSKEFVFEAQNATPQNFRKIDLTTNPNFIKFKPDFIKSEMPYFGRVYGGIDYGGSNIGLQFEGVPKEFSVRKAKKVYQIKVTVKTVKESYIIMLDVSSQGNSSLTISSINRSPITYFGKIMPLKEESK